MTDTPDPRDAFDGAAGPQPAAADLAPGTRLGPYVVLGRLGAGGMGEVYRARDTRLERVVALKVLSGDLIGDTTARHRFEREARAAAALTHPHICTVLDVGRQDNTDYFVMEFVEGATLASRLVRGPVPVREALRIAVEMAEALVAAHAAGIVHRDIKPGNVMLRPDGFVKVLDFGVAKLVGVDANAGDATRTLTTHAGLVVGTVAYMSPEQARGQEVDERTDLWSLGCVLYEMVAGLTPFTGGSSTDLLAEILKGEPIPLSRDEPSVPPELQRIVSKSLRKDRAERYQTAQDLLIDLRALSTEVGHQAADHPAPRKPGGPSGTSPGPTPRAWGRVTAATVVAAALVVAFAIATNVGGLRDRLMGGARPHAIQALAVLPLENLSHDPEQEYFADGLTDELITSLSRFSALKVISRTSVTQYRGSTKPVSQIARELHVDGVLQGSVLRSGDRARITVQLTDGATDRNVWGQSYERDLRDVLALQDEVAHAIAREIQVTVGSGPGPVARARRAVEPQANEDYLKGRYYLTKWTPEGYQKAVEYFAQSIVGDANNPAAYAGLAESYALLAYYGVSAPRDVFPRAKAAALKALELDDTLSEGHTALALVADYYDWDWNRGEQEFRRALQLTPSSAIGHLWYSYHLVWVGQFDAAVAEARRAQELDPLSLVTSTSVGNILYDGGRYAEAADACQRVLDLDPTFRWAHHSLGENFVELGRFKDAVSELTRGLDPEGRNPHFKAKLAYGMARSGDLAGASRIAADLARDAKVHYVPPTQIAAVQVALGRTSDALESLTRAVDVRDSWLPAVTIEPPFQPLHADPEFRRLIRTIGLTPR